MAEGPGPEGGFSRAQDSASMRRFIDMSIDLLAIVDFETRVVELSGSWERTLGWTRDDLMGEPIMKLIHPEDVPRIEAELAGLFAGREAVAVDVRLLAADGGYRWVQGNARSDLDEQRIFVTAADITERKGLEDALRRQLSLEELVATITAGLIAADDVEVPKVIERGIGELAQAMKADRGHFLRGRRQTATTIIEWLHPVTGQRREDVPTPSREVQRWWLDVLRTGRTLRLEDVEDMAAEAPEVVANLREDGVRSVLHVPLSPHRGYWGFLALVAIEEKVQFSDDVTALMRLAGEAFLTALARGDDAAALLDARLELEHRNAELERSNEELERFAYSAAHDLRAPLARIEMALAAAPRPTGDAGQLVDVARRGAARMRQLIEDLLIYSAVGTGSDKAEDVELDDVLTHVLSDLSDAIAATGAEVRRDPLPSVWGHRSLLGQLLQNLVSNSLKFVRPDVRPVISVAGSDEGDSARIRVADNGIGIDQARRNDVFGVFTRLNADEQFPGSGIGLATCAKVVAYHGGQIWLEDGIDGGVAAVVDLPRRPAVP